MYSSEQRQLLKAIARASIEYGLENNQPLIVDLTTIPQQLKQVRASFVTLEKDHHLRGCIGTLEAYRPLAQDIADNSFAAAFTDHRFPPVIAKELDNISIHISILNPTEPIICHTESELKQQLRPNIDGLIIDDGFHKATFLPSVWESLPNTTDFIDQLKIKAGLPADYWSHDIKAFRYTTESF
ncbi:MAG: AmmeMemoRadiSam system protein A [Gammaproteobacteria bacterium]|nr:AmmeMemoRadiSam system protein A [Gammaproteobacteria bacterium]